MHTQTNTHGLHLAGNNRKPLHDNGPFCKAVTNGKAAYYFWFLSTPTNPSMCVSGEATGDETLQQLKYDLLTAMIFMRVLIAVSLEQNYIHSPL